jgi:electron transfer flavoprotein alpha subunit
MTTTVMVCTWQGGRSDPPEERDAALTLGRRVAAQVGAELVWLVLGEAPEGFLDVAAAQGVARVQHLSGDMGDQHPDALVHAAVECCGETRPAAVIVPQTYGARTVVPRVAARLGAGLVMNATEVEASEEGFSVTASAYGGDTRAVYEVGRPAVLALLPNAVEPERIDAVGGPPLVEAVSVDLSSVEERIRVVEAAHSEGPRLEDAEVVVAGGRGLGAPENFELVEQLAEALGGMSAASRPLVDAGWIDSSHQVGLTGKLTRPALYVAAGISGATQHMVGCAAAKTIVAINTDADAAIFHHARFGIVGDCTEVLPELVRAVKDAGVS